MLVPESSSASEGLTPKHFPCPVTLLLGLPLLEEDFIVRIDSEPSCRSDFLAKYDAPDLAPEARNAARRRWWMSRYKTNVADPLLKLARAAIALGCDVRERATLADLGATARGDNVVIVMSHWKGPEFSNDDFLAPFENALESRLAAIDHPLASAIVKSMQPQRSWLPFFNLKPLSARAAVRQSLDAAIAETQTAGDCHYELDATRRARRRALLDTWLHGLIRPGNRLELFDRLHGVADVSSAISPRFTGVLDLTVCTSTWLGDHLGHAAAQRFRTVQFIEPQDFLDASMRIRQVLTVFSEGLFSYPAARQAVNQTYVKVVDELAGSVARRGNQG
jgi:hypothetical protein